MSMNSGVFVRPATKEDTLQIADMLREEGLSLPSKNDSHLVKKHWERLFELNPFYKVFPKKEFIGWVMFDNNKVVGFFGVIPRIYILNNQPVEVYVGSNLGIVKAYRKFAYLICEPFFNMNPESIKITTTAIDSTGKIFKMFKGKVYPDADIINTLFIPFRFENLILTKFKLFDKKYNFLRKTLSIFNYFNPAFIKSFFFKSNIISELVNSIPDEFDIFWQTYLKNYSGFIASRDLDSMRWVYEDVRNDNRKKIFLYRNKQNGDIIAYASLIEEPISLNKNLIRYKIADLLYLDPNHKKSIIKHLIKFCISQRADLLEFHLTPDVSKNDIPVFTFSRKTAYFPVLFHTQNKEIEFLLSQKDFWKISPYDGDTILG